MSNEGAGAVTEKDGKRQGTVPKLRFPDFVGNPVHKIALGDVTEEPSVRNGRSLSPRLVMGVKKDDGIVPMADGLASKDIARYKVVEKDWFAYNPMRLNIGSIARWKGDNDVLVSPDYVAFCCLPESKPTALLASYLDQFRRSAQWNAFVNGSGDGGVRIRIYYDDLAQMRLALPDAREQQKIAECLFSLDALIAAEREKLAALRDHKRGLVRQLFPAKGETIPRHRFPEFRDAEEWETKPLGDIFDTASGGTPDRKKKEFWGGEIPWITTSLVDGNIVSEAAEFLGSGPIDVSVTI